MTFTREQTKRLERYVKGDILLEKDGDLIETLQSTGGLARTSFCGRGKNTKETAKLTQLGYSIYLESKIYHNPFRRFLSGLVSI